MNYKNRILQNNKHGYTAGVWCNDCEQFISGYEEKPLLVPEEPVTEPEEPTTEPLSEPTTVPAAPTGAVHGVRCFCYTYTGNGLFANIVRSICATYSFLWNLRDAIG